MTPKEKMLHLNLLFNLFEELREKNEDVESNEEFINLLNLKNKL
jgi:hypothetical protein